MISTAVTAQQLDQELGSVDIWASRYESRPTGSLPVLDRVRRSGKMLDLQAWC